MVTWRLGIRRSSILSKVKEWDCTKTMQGIKRYGVINESVDGKTTTKTLGDMGLKTVMMMKDLECLAELSPKAQHLIHERYQDSLGHSCTSVMF